jgi:glucokinase
LTGVIGDVGTLPGWQDGNLVSELQREFGRTVVVENDADAAALAEQAWGTAKGVENYIYVTISTGIGGGMILGGKLYRGAGGAHPEVGHQAIDPSGPLCYCRLSGCWESLASGSAMEAWMQEQHPQSTPISARKICELASSGDKRALLCLKREAHYLGIGLANLITLFSPDMIGLGGGLMQSSSLFLDAAVSLINEVCTQVPVHNTRIVLAGLGNNVGLLGAAQCWLRRNPG